MQVRCYNCHKPYAIGKQEAQAALDLIAAQGLSHYDAACPHCRRVNRVSRHELERGLPGWKPSEQEQTSDSQNSPVLIVSFAIIETDHLVW